MRNRGFHPVREVNEGFPEYPTLPCGLGGLEEALLGVVEETRKVQRACGRRESRKSGTEGRQVELECNECGSPEAGRLLRVTPVGP